jgi:hypothetical protein
LARITFCCVVIVLVLSPSEDYNCIVRLNHTVYT